jgi:transposase
MSKKSTATHERVDDIPTIIAHLKKMRVAALLDKHFPSKGHGQGWSLGWTTVVWVTCLLSEGAHRLSRVAPWVNAPPCPCSRCSGRQVTPRDLSDDRLATVRASLCVAARWGECERARNQSVLRVYDVQARAGHVETTTAAADVTPEGLFQLGHSKDHRPDLPQGKVALSVLDPLGAPLTTTVVAGHTADAPRSRPEMAQVRQIAQRTGRPYVGDCTMAAIGTRAAIVAHQDASWGPLSAKPMPEAALDRVLAPVLRGALEPSELRLPNADGALEETDAPVALGCAYTVERRAPDQAQQTRTWQERHLVVRSLAFAARQEQRVRPRVARAVTESNALDARQQGTQRVPDEAAAPQAVAAIMAHSAWMGWATSP